jgi:hypothetical protein
VTHIALLTVALVWVAGCSGADNRPPVADLGSAGAAGSTGGGSAGAGGATNTTPDPTCNEGTARECKVRLPSHAGVSNCFVGVQLCDSGKWGNCMDPADVR